MVNGLSTFLTVQLKHFLLEATFTYYTKNHTVLSSIWVCISPKDALTCALEEKPLTFQLVDNLPSESQLPIDCI